MAHILANAEGVFPFLREHGVFFNGDADVTIVANAAGVPMSVRLGEREVHARVYFSSIGKFGGHHHIHVAPFVVKRVTNIQKKIKNGFCANFLVKCHIKIEISDVQYQRLMES